MKSKESNSFKDQQKVMECLNKARRFADFAMTNPKNLILFVEYLNKLLYFFDHDQKSVDIKPEQINDLIELIKGHIRTIKSIISDDISYLYSERYIEKTITNFAFTAKYLRCKQFFMRIIFP